MIFALTFLFVVTFGQLAVGMAIWNHNGRPERGLRRERSGD